MPLKKMLENIFSKSGKKLKKFLTTCFQITMTALRVLQNSIFVRKKYMEHIFLSKSTKISVGSSQTVASCNTLI